MWKIRDVKRNGMNTLKNNFWTLVLVGIITSFLIGNNPIGDRTYQNGKIAYNMAETIEEKQENRSLSDENREEIIINYSNQIISQIFYGNLGGYIRNYNEKNNIKKGIFYTIVNKFYDSETKIKDFLNEYVKNNPYSTIQRVLFIIIIGLISILFKILITSAIRVGKSRVFMESINYKETKIRTLTYSFKEGNYRAAVNTMFIKYLYLILWSFTIIGLIIKHYSYLMCEYIIAENPNIGARECIKMSKEMMKGNKWKTFKLDCTFILWNILNVVTFGFAGLLITPYYEATFAELYRVLREEYKNNKKENYIELNDNLLFEDNNDFTTYEVAKNGERRKNKRLEVDFVNYDKIDYVLLFFIFAFVGWIWEVFYFALHFGVIVNRGALYGPWLPIYGFGCTLAIFLFSNYSLLKKTQNNPLKTFIYVMGICTVIEYFTSLYLELRTGATYWDYTGIFMNINGRVCLENSMFFGVGGCLCIYFVGPWLYKTMHKLKTKTKVIISIVLLVLFMTDVAVCQIHPHYGEFISNDPSIQEMN